MVRLAVAARAKRIAACASVFILVNSIAGLAGQIMKIADPVLEALSVGQKALVRLSPDQRERVKRQLRALRGALAQG